ncbi:MAG: Holliday junction branch migration protein RuvA [Anaeroplasmataceae bacterium]
MIYSIKGNIIEIFNTHIIFESNNISYIIHKPVTMFVNVENEIIVYIVQIIKENSNELYGFINKEYRTLFSTLITLNGIGPKIALRICESDVFEIYDICTYENYNRLKELFKLSDKICKSVYDEFNKDKYKSKKLVLGNTHKVVDILNRLGYKKEDVLRVTENLNLKQDLDENIRNCLLKLGQSNE